MVITYEMPFAEIMYDFFDKLKSSTKGYASLDYEIIDYRQSVTWVRLDNPHQHRGPWTPSRVIVHRQSAYPFGRSLAEKLKKSIPRQMVEVIIQAAIGNKIHRQGARGPLPQGRHRKC